MSTCRASSSNGPDAPFPSVRFVQADATELRFAPGTFDAVASFFMFGHVPRAEQEPLLRSIATWLRPGGRLLATLGTADTEDEIEDEWLGAPMFFASYSEEENRVMVERAGFEIEEAHVVPFDEPGHGLVRFMWVLAQKPE